MSDELTMEAFKQEVAEWLRRWHEPSSEPRTNEWVKQMLDEGEALVGATGAQSKKQVDAEMLWLFQAQRTVKSARDSMSGRRKREDQEAFGMGLRKSITLLCDVEWLQTRKLRKLVADRFGESEQKYIAPHTKDKKSRKRKQDEEKEVAGKSYDWFAVPKDSERRLAFADTFTLSKFTITGAHFVADLCHVIEEADAALALANRRLDDETAALVATRRRLEAEIAEHAETRRLIVDEVLGCE